MLASRPLGMHSPQITQPSPAKGLSAPMTGHRAALAGKAGEAAKARSCRLPLGMCWGQQPDGNPSIQPAHRSSSPLPRASVAVGQVGGLEGQHPRGAPRISPSKRAPTLAAAPDASPPRRAAGASPSIRRAACQTRSRQQTPQCPRPSPTLPSPGTDCGHPGPTGTRAEDSKRLISAGSWREVEALLLGKHARAVSENTARSQLHKQALYGASRR